jgi:hypothetical protein
MGGLPLGANTAFREDAPIEVSLAPVARESSRPAAMGMAMSIEENGNGQALHRSRAKAVSRRLYLSGQIGYKIPGVHFQRESQFADGIQGGTLTAAFQDADVISVEVPISASFSCEMPFDSRSSRNRFPNTIRGSMLVLARISAL